MYDPRPNIPCFTALSIALAVMSLAGCGSGDGTPAMPPGTSDDAWSCLGAVAPDKPVESEATLSVRPTLTAWSGPIALSACGADDAACADPIASAMIEPPAEEGGSAEGSLTVPTGATGWTGYVQIVGATELPILVFELPPVTGSRVLTDLPWTAVALAPEQIAEATGVSLAPGRGAVAFQVRDCTGAPAGGVQLTADTADGLSTTIYLADMGASFAGPASDRGSDALGLILDLPAGAATLTAALAGTGTPVAHADVIVRAETTTAVELPPTP